MTTSASLSTPAMRRGVLEHEADAAALDRLFPPRGLREHAGEIGCVGALENAPRDMGQALVGQHDQPRQIVLNMPKLALLVKQVAKNHRVLSDDGSRGHYRPFHDTPPGPCQPNRPGPRVAWGI